MGDLLTVVAPVFNEEVSFEEFDRRLTNVADRLAEDGLDVEVVYVDDGSTDGSAKLIAGRVVADPRVRAITLSRNFGHQAAVSAGLDRARGDAVVVIDSDLQDPPEVIPELVERWRAGSEVVHAVRTQRHGESWFKRRSASAFYRAIRGATDLDIHVNAGDFRLLGRRAVDAIRAMPEQFRFLRGMAAWVGFNQSVVPYVRDARHGGASKYSLRRMVRLAINAFTSFSFVPLQLVAAFGFLISAFTVIAVPVVVVLRLSGVKGLGGQTTVLLAVLLLGGVQMLSLGVIGEYLGRMAIEVKRRPLYIVASETATGSPSGTTAGVGSVVMDDEARQRHIDAVGHAHRALLDHLGAMTGRSGADPTAPSLLPGWTRGHVLTHIARNADSFVRVLEAAERGEVVSQYEGGFEGRNADIEAGAGRDWDTLVEDVRSSAAGLEAVFANQDNWDLAMVNALGDEVPHRDIPFRRLREVLIHHADIGDPGFTAENWPADYQREELRRMEMVYSARKPMGATGLPELALQAPPLQRLRWLVGRGEIEGLEPAGVF